MYIRIHVDLSTCIRIYMYIRIHVDDFRKTIKPLLYKAFLSSILLLIVREILINTRNSLKSKEMRSERFKFIV